MSSKHHLPVLGANAVGQRTIGSPLVQVLLSALASLLLWLPLGMLGLYVARALRGWLPAGTSPALGLLAIAPLLLSFALALFLAEALTMRPNKGRWAVAMPLASALLTSALAAALAKTAGMLGSAREGVLVALVLFVVSVPAALAGLRFAQRYR